MVDVSFQLVAAFFYILTFESGSLLHIDDNFFFNNLSPAVEVQTVV